VILSLPSLCLFIFEGTSSILDHESNRKVRTSNILTPESSTSSACRCETGDGPGLPGARRRRRRAGRDRHAWTLPVKRREAARQSCSPAWSDEEMGNTPTNCSLLVLRLRELVNLLLLYLCISITHVVVQKFTISFINSGFFMAKHLVWIRISGQNCSCNAVLRHILVPNFPYFFLASVLSFLFSLFLFPSVLFYLLSVQHNLF